MYEEVFHPKNRANSPAPNRGPTQKLVADLNFTNWARGTCTFQCKICNYTTGGSVDFWKHVKNKHSLEIEAYKDMHGNPCIVLNKITCVACKAILRYDYGTLLGHATNKHGMVLIEFYNKFYRHLPKKNDEKPTLTDSEGKSEKFC